MAMVVNETKLNAAMTATADAIREKLGSEEQIPFDYNGGTGFADAVEAIPQGGYDMTVTDNQVKALVNITPATSSFYTMFNQSTPGGVTVDFGDGTVEVSGSQWGTEYDAMTEISHTYSEPGTYVITWTCTEGTMAIQSQFGTTLILPVNAVEYRKHHLTNDYNYWLPWLKTIQELSFGQNILITYGFYGLQSLTKFTKFPTKVDGKTTLSTYELGVYDIVFAEGIENIIDYTLQSGKQTSVVIPSTIKSIGDRAFTNCTSCVLYDFTSIELVDGALPFVVSGAHVWQSLNTTYCRILFKDAETAAVAKATTNLTPYAAYIHYVGE